MDGTLPARQIASEAARVQSNSAAALKRLQVAAGAIG